MFWHTNIICVVYSDLVRLILQKLVFDENRSPRNIFLMCANKKKSLDAKSGLCGGWLISSTFWQVKKELIWSDVRELALSFWTRILLFLFVFRISPKKLWCTTQNWLCNVVLVQQSLHDKFCQRNRPAFASNCFFHKQLSLVLACFRRLVVLFLAHTHIFMICQLWRSYKRILKHCHCIFPTFLCTSRQEPFLSDCGIQRDQKLFMPCYGHVFMQYRMYVGSRNAQGSSHEDLALLVHAWH